MNSSHRPTASAFAAQYADLLERERKTWGQPGLAVAVVDLDRWLLVRGFGVRAAGRDEPVNEKTRFALASCSKPFASATVARLVDSGKLGWDDRVRCHLPDFRLYDEEVSETITVRDLLCNRVGLLSSEGRFRRVATDRPDLIRRLAHRRPLHAFRAAYAYQTDMFTVAGELVSRVARTEWSDFARQTFWAPLGMDRTNADHCAAQADDNWARPHRFAQGIPHEIPWIYEDDVAVPAGGVNSTAADMAQWMGFWNRRGTGLHSTVLREKTIAELVAPHTPIQGLFADSEFSCATSLGPDGIRFESYALGWYRHDYSGHAIVVHTGSIPGFTAVTGFLWEEKRGIAVLANSAATYFSRAMFQAGIDLSVGRDPEQTLTRFRALQEQRDALPTEILPIVPFRGEAGADFVGGFSDDGCWGKISIESGPAGLRARCGGQAFSLQPLAPDFFSFGPELPWPSRPEMTLRFARNLDHSVIGFVMDDGVEFRRTDE